MRERLGVVVICAAHFLIGVDGVAVAIALPALQRDLGAAPVDGQWVLSGYGLAFGGCLLLGGRLGDLYGRRRMLMAGLAVFGAGAAAAGFAPSLETLVAARVVQGLGAAAAVPASLALIGSLFPPGRERTRALSLLAATTSAGVITGLLAGGVLTGLLGWRWVFLALPPLALAAAAAAPALVAEARAEPPVPAPDIPGALLITTGLVAAIAGLTRGSAGLLVIGVVLAGGFVVWERRADAPLMQLELLHAPSLRTAVLGAGVNSITFTGIVYVGTLYLQDALGYGAVAAGAALLPVDVVAFVVPIVAGGYVARRSPRTLLAWSFAASAAGLLWLARAREPASYIVDVLAPLALLGASLSLAYVLLTQQAVADVGPDEKGVASGIFETANHLVGGAVGVAVYATVLHAG